MSFLTKKVFFALFGFIFTGASIYYLTQSLDQSLIKKSFEQINLGYFFIGVFINIFGYFMHACRWSVFFSDNKDIPLIDFYHSVVLGHLSNTILPSKTGEFIRPYFIYLRHNTNYIKLLTSCVIERVFDIIFSLTFILFSLFFVLGNFENFFWDELIKFLYALGFILLILILANRSLLVKLTNLLPSFLKNRILPIIQDTKELIKSLTFKQYKKIFSFTFLFWLCGTVTMYCLFLASPLPAELQQFDIAIYICGTLALALTLPSAPANIGVFNISLIVLFKYYLNSKGIQITEQMEQDLILSSVIIHLGSLVPDFLMGTFSLIKLNLKFTFLRGDTSTD